MPRQPRIEFPGAVYHIVARGNEGKEIFRSDHDRFMFLSTLGEAAERFNLRIYAYCLMPNHYHLIIQTPEGNLSRSVGWLQVTYTTRFNLRYKRIGHLFQGRYKAHLVGDGGYGARLVYYIHLNPVRSQNKQRIIPVNRWNVFNTYRWSSHSAYRDGKRSYRWLDLSWLRKWGNSLEKAKGVYLREVRGYFGREIQSPWEDLKGGVVLGDEIFLKKIEKYVHQSSRKVPEFFKDREMRRRKQKIQEWLKQESDKSVRLWLRIFLGGERMADVAREMNYRSSGGVFNRIQRLKKEVTQNVVLKQKLAGYEEELR